MRFLVAAIAVLVLAVLGLSSFGASRSEKVMQGELRCEGAGGVIINVDGKDYAVPAAWPVRAILQFRAFGTAPHTQKPI
jgi:hypothetical protein